MPESRIYSYSVQDMQKAAEELRRFTVDFDGSQMKDGEVPIDGLTCWDLRRFAAMLDQASRSGPNGDGWISIKDRLPEPGQSVALVNVERWENCGDDMERNIHDAGYLSVVGELRFWSIRGERAQMLTAFTHWMPLPSSPATSDQSQKEG